MIDFSDTYTVFSVRNNIDSMFADKDNSYAVAKFKVIKRSRPDENEEFVLRKKIYKSEAWFKDQNNDGRSNSKKVFIGGSKNITKLDETVQQKLDKLISENAEILIGDCHGADAMVQYYLHINNYERVTIYATDGNARASCGNWPVINVPSHDEEGYEYYQLKDIEMAKDADEAFMIWDGKSRGTAFNIEEMQNLGKRVYIHQQDNKDRNPNNGVFWLIDDKLYAFPYNENKYREAVSKSGTAYNHQKIWEYIRPKGCSNKPFDYYPRGRVIIIRLNNQPVIYMNPNISEKYVPEIMEAFNLQKDPIIRYDYSEHYKCYLDE